VNGLLAALDIPAPEIDYTILMPILIVMGSAVLSVLVEAFVARSMRRSVQLGLVTIAISLAFFSVISNHTEGRMALGAVNSLSIDGPGTFLQGLILLCALVGALYMAERFIDPQGDGFAAQASALPGSEDETEFTNQGWFQTEIWPLFLFSVGGMLIFPVANDFLTLFIALEVMSLPLYLLAGMARRRRLLSQEAAMKYFVLGAFASAFLLYGSALLYGYAGSVEFSAVAYALSQDAGRSGLVVAGSILVFVGLLFKVGAAPFHQWTPDVYQGSPTSLTAFMSAATKVAAFGALLRVAYVALGGVRWDWQPMMWAVAIATMIIGTVVGVAQSDIKRMLAYSSIAHAGFLLLAVIAVSSAGLSSALFYLAAYAFTTLGTFGVVSLVRDATGEATNIGQWAGLGKRSPVVAGVFAFFLLALAGIPLTSGFTGKFAVFAAAYEGGAAALVIIAVIASAIAAFFYVRVIVLMFFTEPQGEEVSVVIPSVLTQTAIALCVAVTVILGLVPQPVLDLLDQAIFLR
jgi:NADH-quinone oxidoreductase subunit N